MRYIFPFKDINPDSRIIIYGATQTGYDFYRQVKTTGFCEIVAWLDRQYEWWRELGLPVDPPDSIRDKQFDLVILTAEKERTADLMKKDLVDLGVPEGKIFWKDDYSVKENIAKEYDPERFKREAEDAVSESPLKYLNEDNLDITVRVMYAKDILSGTDCSKHREMYKRIMVNQMGEKEPTDDMIPAYFTEYTMKKGWKAFDKSFRELLDSMKDKGFDRKQFIPTDSDGGLINGRHRLASAIALGIPVWTRQYRFSGFHHHFDEQWLGKMGFSPDEISEIMQEYRRLQK